MILPFSTQINKKPSYFPEKILMGLLVKRLTPEPDFNSICPRGVIIPKGNIIYNIHFDHTINHKPKYHTIREDKKNRWKVGTKIDFFINARQKNMYRFAPVLPVVSIQKVEIVYELSFYKKKTAIVYIDDKLFYHAVEHNNEFKMLDFANNDGFDTIEDFFAYFNKPYIGKLIHWTDKKY